MFSDNHGEMIGTWTGRNGILELNDGWIVGSPQNYLRLAFTLSMKSLSKANILPEH